jgi:exodeoxyribonuclease-5
MARAGELIRSLGKTPVADPAEGLSAEELAGCVARTLALPRVAALRPSFQAEFPVYGILTEGGGEIATAGIADALTLTATGAPDAVVDWKSDVNQNAGAIDHYRAQVATYLKITRARQGLIVFMTSGTILEVLPSSQGRRIPDSIDMDTRVVSCVE